MLTDTTRTALITGSNRGIGLETARQLLDRGVRVLISGRDSDAVHATVEDLNHPAAVACILDVTKEASIYQCLLSLEQPVDILINNAGILLDSDRGLLAVDEQDLRRTLDTNLYGPLRLCQAIVPGMRDRGWGRVVNVSSGYGAIQGMDVEGPCAYKVSKAALNALTRIVAGEAGDPVKVNAVDPGWVQTRMGGREAPRSVGQAAEGIVWAATLPDDGPTGGFFHDGQPREW